MMNDNRPKVTADVQRLIDMEDEMILAKDIAPIVHIKPDVIIKYVKTGQWDAGRLGNFVTSGDHVKFFRKDFLVKCGFMEPEKEEPTVEQQLLETLKDIREMLICMMTAGQALVYAMRRDEKSAGAGTPTD